MAGSLTVANSALLLSVEALYPAAQRLQGYSADDAYDPDAVENGEYSMGIDGKLSAGFVFNPIPFSITLQADSPSLTLFENVYQYEQSNRTKLASNLTVTIPALSRRYELKNGYMRSYKAPAGKKILQPAAITLVFERLQISPL
jgi:hypothetical protein